MYTNISDCINSPLTVCPHRALIFMGVEACFMLPRPSEPSMPVPNAHTLSSVVTRNPNCLWAWATRTFSKKESPIVLKSFHFLSSFRGIVLWVSLKVLNSTRSPIIALFVRNMVNLTMLNNGMILILNTHMMEKNESIFKFVVTSGQNEMIRSVLSYHHYISSLSKLYKLFISQ